MEDTPQPTNHFHLIRRALVICALSVGAAAPLLAAPTGRKLPKFSQWTPRAPVPFPLADHVAVVVDNIIYVMAGRSFYYRANKAVAAYDPVSNSWEMKASMPYMNRDASACVLNGKIYVLKGNTGTLAEHNFIEYDPKTNKWTEKAPAPGDYPNKDVCAGSYDGRVYLTGKNAIYAYDPARDAWSKVESAGGVGSKMIGPVIYAVEPEFKSMELGALDWTTLTQPHERQEAAAVAVTNSRLYLVGGGEGFNPLRGVMEYDPGSNQWTAKSPLNYSVQGHAVAAVDGTLYVLGGVVGTVGTIPYVEAYTPSADNGANPLERRPEKRSWVGPKWQPAAPMPTPRSALSVVSVGRCPITTIGGQISDKVVSNVETYEPVASGWRAKHPLNEARRYAGAGCLNTTLYVAGGQDETHDIKSVEAHDSRLEHTRSGWNKLAPLSSPRSKLGLIGTNGKVYAIGGERNGKLTNIVEAYDPATDRWSPQPPVPAPVAPGDAVTTDGRIISVYAEASSPYCFKRVYKYDTWERVWTTSESLPHPSCIMGWKETTVPPRRRQDFQMGGFDRSFFAYGGRDERGEVAQVDELIVPDHNGAFDYWTSPKEPEPPAEAPAVKRKSWRPHDFAVVVGIDGYRSLPPARGGERDAASMAHHLRDTLGLPEENIIVLTKERASRADFSSIVEEWIPKNVSPDSRVYFYFAGHGTIDPVDQSSYLLPWDADLAFLRSSAYSLNRFFRNLEALKARQVIVFLDCCFDSDAERCRESRGLRPLVAYKDAGPGPASKITVYFAASKKESAGVDQAANGGLFTGALIDGLTGPAAERKSGTLTVEDLFLYIQKRVNTGAETQGRTQNPRLYSSNRGLRIY